MKFETSVGDPTRLGAQCDADGVNFALFSANAKRVELCLYDAKGEREIARLDLPEQTHDVWHGYVPGLAPGAVYGYRVHGRYEPHAGHRFNHNKLLVDPYATQLCGEFVWRDENFGYDKSDALVDLAIDTRDNAAFVPKAVVSASNRLNGHSLDDSPREVLNNKPRLPWQQTLLYELHVRGFTIAHPALSEAERGRFAGLAHSEVIAYLKSLGVTSVELLPVHAFIDEHFLFEKGLSNYWGYNTLNFFTPHSAYLGAGSGDVAQFRRMVDTFHDAGMEVILDVVYNHTCESNHLGPTLSFRGIDNAAYYRLQSEDRRYYVNDTGCGNTLNISHPRVLQLVLDSMRYWAGPMGVDGFRFDLATVLGRSAAGYNPQATFFQAVAQDPVLSRIKLIAEPWDIGPGGYQLGKFPAPWSEWNDDFRDTARKFWRSSPGVLPTFARRLHGSSDIFEHTGRRPYASINYIASHDGFTLRDLVSYESRHNEANGEENRDGHRDNLGMNFGVEGETDDALINSLRRRQQRNFLATVFFAQGVPMLLAGDEMGRSQRGNNNAYCQDNAINWLDWETASSDLQAFVRLLSQLRREYSVLSHDKYIHRPFSPEKVNIQWMHADGSEMRDEHWRAHHQFTLGYMLTPPADTLSTATIPGGRVLAVFNNADSDCAFQLPATGRNWRWLMDSCAEDGQPATTVIDQIQVPIAQRSVCLFADS
ncbi:MAG: glycogen debranching protein GlgX [Pseudomonadales bacterium]